MSWSLFSGLACAVPWMVFFNFFLITKSNIDPVGFFWAI